MKAIVLVFFLSSFLFGSLFSNKFDEYFKKEYNKYFFAYKHIYDYNIIKAQSYQESLFQVDAKSYVGASGLMQLMPKTFEELLIRTNKSGNITDPKLNIELGVFYDFQQFNQWKSKRTLESRYKLMFASYNAGLGNLLKAQKKCIEANLKNCNEYNSIESFLHLVTGHYSNETKTYVKNIFSFFKKLNSRG